MTFYFSTFYIICMHGETMLHNHRTKFVTHLFCRVLNTPHLCIPVTPPTPPHHPQGTRHFQLSLMKWNDVFGQIALLLLQLTQVGVFADQKNMYLFNCSVVCFKLGSHWYCLHSHTPNTEMVFSNVSFPPSTLWTTMYLWFFANAIVLDAVLCWNLHLSNKATQWTNFLRVGKIWCQPILTNLLQDLWWDLCQHTFHMCNPSLSSYYNICSNHFALFHNWSETAFDLSFLTHCSPHSDDTILSPNRFILNLLADI